MRTVIGLLRPQPLQLQTPLSVFSGCTAADRIAGAAVAEPYLWLEACGLRASWTAPGQAHVSRSGTKYLPVYSHEYSQSAQFSSILH